MVTTAETLCCNICTLNHATGDHYGIKPLKLKAFRRAELTDAEKGEINQLWHLSRVEGHGRYTRLSYVFRWFRRRHASDYSDKALWLAIDEETQLVK